MVGQFWCSHADDQQERFLYKLDVEIIFSYGSLSYTCI